MAKVRPRLLWLGLGAMVLSCGAPSVSDEDVQAPWMGGDGIHYLGKVHSETDIPSDAKDLWIEGVAVTRDGLVASVPAEADPNPDLADEETWSALYELPTSGEAKKLTTRRLGTAIGDIRGSTVFWAEPRGRRIQLVAYDTAHHRVLRTLNVKDSTLRVYAVDRTKAYLMGDGSIRLWDAAAADNHLTKVPNYPHYGGGLTDAHDGTLFVNAGEKGSLITGSDGRVVQRFRDTFFATFSPDGKYLAALQIRGKYADESVALVWSLDRSATVRLELPAKINVIEVQWEADGDLLLFSEPSGEFHEPTMTIHSCSPASGSCALFEGARWQHTTSGNDQFAYDAY